MFIHRLVINKFKREPLPDKQLIHLVVLPQGRHDLLGHVLSTALNIPNDLFSLDDNNIKKSDGRGEYSRLLPPAPRGRTVPLTNSEGG